MSVDVRSNHKGNNIEERHPGLFGKKLLRKGKCDGGGDPADPHHGPETSTDGGAYLMPGTGASDEGHASQVDGVLNWRDLGCIYQYCLIKRGKKAYKQVACQDLEDFGTQTSAASEDLLKQVDQEMTHRSADKSSISSHFRHSRAEVVAMLASVVRKPRCDDFLKRGERPRSKHLGAKRVLLKLSEVCLNGALVSLSHATSPRVLIPQGNQSDSFHQSRLRQFCVLCHCFRCQQALSLVSSVAETVRCST